MYPFAINRIPIKCFSGLRTSSASLLSTIRKMAKYLAAFDFDHTIIESNSDTAVMNLIDKSKIPDEIRALHRKDGWTAFMQGIFKLLHDNGKTESDIINLIENLSPVRGFDKLLIELKQLNHDIIIISDSNSFFIDVWLKHHQLSDKILKVFTNPAEFDADGLLTIKMYHLQDYCALSTKNLCKGQILVDFIEGQRQCGVCYDKIIYCGDGENDFCPILRLSDTDWGCVRDKYKCQSLVEKARNGQLVDKHGAPRCLKAKIIVWNNGYDILKQL